MVSLVFYIKYFKYSADPFFVQIYLKYVYLDQYEPALILFGHYQNGQNLPYLYFSFSIDSCHTLVWSLLMGRFVHTLDIYRAVLFRINSIYF